MWQGFNPDDYIINKILNKYFEMEQSDTPDYIIGSVYSKEALKYEGIRIFYTGENICPDFNMYDYAIGFEHLHYGDRYTYVPNYIMNPKYADDIQNMLIKHEKGIKAGDKVDFCSFVVSNGSADSMREHFFKELSKYKTVNSGGKYKNNIGLPNGVPDKFEFQRKHKFSMCFENSSHPGYITEKLIQGFAAGTVPIYYGASDVTSIFNEKAMIVVKDEYDIGRAIQQIIDVDSDDDLYKKIMDEPALVESDYIDRIQKELEDFLINIFAQDLSKARRRTDSQTVRAYYELNESKASRRRLFKIKL